MSVSAKEIENYSPVLLNVPKPVGGDLGPVDVKVAVMALVQKLGVFIQRGIARVVCGTVKTFVAASHI